MEEIRKEAAEEIKEEAAAAGEAVLPTEENKGPVEDSQPGKTEEIGTTETMEDYSKELEASFRVIKEGDVLSGSVIDVNEEGVTLDLNY